MSEANDGELKASNDIPIGPSGHYRYVLDNERRNLDRIYFAETGAPAGVPLAPVPDVRPVFEFSPEERERRLAILGRILEGDPRSIPDGRSDRDWEENR
jgi:hypothetical protein